ncbi:DUF3025 domain-containing protein [Lacimicrobium alkaliphilum]|uniref:DUF3025 domain-containing protein n=1 Tax=Lacimicrobium alkaliphilum TaxID=1526571 RepID=A0A0U2Z7M2_9ALTE|nr:DUF3025 domain-containing protein [Lacimicrobium alkaliphilum]ALS98931.1 hypothetical protein AT746_12055 [Lacimicrobium alkaliphilum]
MQPSDKPSNKTSDRSAQRRFSAHLPQQWQSRVFAHQPLAQLDQLFSISELQQWPDCDWLNRDSGLEYQFVAQDELDMGETGYEEFIHRYRQIPTRTQNWHDLFNALIWRQFPQAKTALNQLHMQDIERFGAKSRTPRRDRITHFDECGVILAYSNSDIAQMLRNHRWQQALYDNRDCWGQSIQAFIFGHANYEMLLHPYIGLTGKWLGIEVTAAFFESTTSLPARLQALDTALHNRLINQDCLAQKGHLHPLPLLGIPGWWEQNQQPEFYLNTDYFMPKRGQR